MRIWVCNHKQGREFRLGAGYRLKNGHTRPFFLLGLINDDYGVFFNSKNTRIEKLNRMTWVRPSTWFSRVAWWICRASILQRLDEWRLYTDFDNYWDESSNKLPDRPNCNQFSYRIDV